MLNSRSIQGIIVLLAALFLSIWLGQSIVTNQLETIIQIIAAVVLISCLFLGRKIWLLIPFMLALNISLRIPGQPSTLILGQILAIAFSTLLFLMRKLPFRLVWSELEFWGLILTAFIGQVYLRNPVGVNLFGGDTVGGKGYALYAIALLSALLLCGLKVPTNQLKWVLPLSILGGILNTLVSILGSLVPSIGFYTGAVYQATDENAYDNQVVDTKNATRIYFLSTLSNNLALWVCSYISPLKALIRPLVALVLLAALVLAMLSGFRNCLISVVLTLILGIAYRSGPAGVFAFFFAGITGLALLAIVNSIHPLPPNIQRSLTFLPGTWEQRYKDDAKGSTEWRVEVWREVLFTDRWIQNKLLGDGLGFSAAEFAAQLSYRQGTRAGISGFDAHRESVLANGDYHSGPVSTVRVIGYIGLLFFLIAQIRLAVHAHRQIQRCRGTEWLPLAMFLGIPVIYGPLFFVFVFGDFKTNASSFLISLSMIRLLENNLPLPQYLVSSARNRMPYLLPAKKREAIQRPG